jgi:hemoglobin
MGRPRADLRDRTDVERMVERFYRRCFADDLLGPVFTDVARLDLPAHLPVMCDFWETVLFRTGAYRRNAYTVHAALHGRRELDPGGLTGPMFQRWLAIWCANVDELYTGPLAERAKLQAGRIAASIERRLALRPRPSDAGDHAQLAAATTRLR